MKPGKIRSLSLVFFAALLFASGSGFYFISAVTTLLYRAGREVSHENLVRLELTKDEYKSLTWIGEKDFYYHGVLYDAERMETHGDKIILTCEQDKVEGSILTAVKKQSANDDPAGRGKRKCFFFFPCYAHAASNMITRPGNIHVYIVEQDNMVRPAFAMNTSPPPEV